MLPRLTLLAVAIGMIAPVALAADERRPNIVFILADDLGYTDVATYGSKYYETPHIDRLAAEGVKFTDGYTCGPNCQPTRAALLSGQYGPRTGVYTVGGIDRFNWQSRALKPVENKTRLPLDRVTVADSLKKAGYTTGLFGKWHLGNGPQFHPSRRGFDEAIVAAGKHYDFRTDPVVDYPEGTYLADFLTDRAVDFIERHREEPFFLYLPHFGVHSPHQAKQEWIDHFEKKPAAGGHHDPTYAAMIASVDESVGRVLKKLDELELSESTLVIFSSDNGGVGGYRRVGLDRDGITDNAPLKGGKGTLAEGGIRVPYLFRWTGTIPAGGVNNTPINSVDLYPSLLDVAGATPPDDYILDGESYLPLLKGERETLARDAIFWHFPGYLGAGPGQWRTTPVSVVRAGDWKLLEYHEEGRLELYNLREDVSEQDNRAARETGRVKELHDKLTSWREEIKAPMPTKNENITDDGKVRQGPRRQRRAQQAL